MRVQTRSTGGGGAFYGPSGPAGATAPDLRAEEAEPLVLGLDEAGRGSLLGPLVVGGFLVSERRLDGLRALGVRDSKQLSPARRDVVYRALAGEGRRLSVSLPPAQIDAFVREGRLNELEARAFGRLVRLAGPDRVYADACDPVAARFGRAVRSWARCSVPVVAEHRADETYPVVAAASIVAKVRRDRAIARLRTSTHASFGSGYPSDVRTIAFVRELVAEGLPVPGWVRRSWRTMGRLMPRPGAATLESFSR